jgi:hypothetical protein
MAVEWQIDTRPFSPQPNPDRQAPDREAPDRKVPDLAMSPAPATDELFRWAQFLAQGEALSVARHRAIEALLEAADYDRDAIYATRLYALRALRRGLGTKDVVELLQAVLDESPRPAESA